MLSQLLGYSRSAFQIRRVITTVFVLFAFALVPAAAGSLTHSGNHTGFIDHGGKRRTYLLHTPRVFDGHPLPLIVVLHGGMGTARTARRMSGMDAKADKEGFFVVYPNGDGPFPPFLQTWNAGGCCGFSASGQVDDVGFIRKLLQHLRETLPIDPSRIFVTGISNGGMMANRIGCALSDVVAAVAPVAGCLYTQGCQPLSPVSVVAFNGTRDKAVLYNGGIGTTRIGYKVNCLSVSECIKFWVDHNHCRPQVQREERGNIIKETYGGGLNGTEVVVYTIKGGQHAWPGGKQPFPFAQMPSRDISATDAMWDFFTHHPKTRPVTTATAAAIEIGTTEKP